MRRNSWLAAVSSIGCGALALRLRGGEQFSCSRDVLGTLAADGNEELEEFDELTAAMAIADERMNLAGQ